MWCCVDSQDVGLEAAIIKRKRNSSLVKRHCAENVTGLKHFTEAADLTAIKKSSRQCGEAALKFCKKKALEVFLIVVKW